MTKDKITSQEIIDLVATKLSISKRLSEDFLKNMFATIEESLLQGESVKIKNFGTFKLQWNEPRKSVNVNTGEEIILDGFNKISFIPENTLKDIVNEPFAHLEPVVLGENRTEKQNSTDPIKTLNQQAIEIKNILSEINSTPANDTKNQYTDLENSSEDNKIEINEVNSTIEDEYANTTINDNIEIGTGTEDSSKQIEELTETEKIDENTELIQPATNENSIGHDDSESENVNTDSGNKFVQIIQSKVDEEDNFIEKLKKRRKFYALITLLFLAGAVLLLYFYNLPFHTWTNKNILSISVNPKNWNNKGTINNFQSINDNKRIADSLLKENINNKQEIDLYNRLMQESRKTEEFISIDRTRPHTTLQSLSESFYGHKNFWVYIFDANKEDIDDTLNLKRGTLIKVPKLDERLIDVNNPKSFETAQKLHDLLFKKPAVSEKISETVNSESPINQLKETKPAQTNSKSSATLATITIKAGDRLTNFSKQYYGHKDFWFYIFEANKHLIDDPNNLPVGTTIKIPALDASLIDLKNPECIQNARKLYENYIQKKK